MKKNFFVIFALVTLILLSGCSDIVYPPKGVSIVDMGEDVDESQISAGSVSDKYKLKKFDLTEKKFEWEKDAHKHRVFEESVWDVTVELNSSQHYRIGVNAVAVSGSPVVVLATITEDEKIVEYGAFYITAGEESSEEENYCYVEPVYLPEGETQLFFMVYRGNVRFDKVSIHNTSAISPERFRTSVSLSNPTPSAEAIAVYEYLNLNFGSKVLTAQHCTVNTNAEIDAVYEATGRFPAVRFGEASGFFTTGNVDSEIPNTDEPETAEMIDITDNQEVALSKQWHKKGGIVAYTWMWEIDENAFSLSEAVGNIENSGVALMDRDFIETMVESGEISPSCRQIIIDIDTVARSLAALGEEGIPVLFNPLPDGGSRLHWWGKSGGEVYVRLWKLMYARMVDYHGLDSLIWIWSGGSHQYYPGDNRVDLIGESSFPRDVMSSEAVKLNYTAHYNSDTRTRKPAMITASSGFPSPDMMARDNAGWLIWSLYKGDFVIDSQGALLKSSKNMLDSFYNHELTICLDSM